MEEVIPTLKVITTREPGINESELMTGLVGSTDT